MSEEKFNDPLEKIDPIMASAFSQPPTPSEKSTATNDADEQSTPQKTASDPNEMNRFFDSDEAFRTDENLLDDATDSDDERVSISHIDFGAPLELSETSQFDKELFKNIKVDVNIELGRTQLSLNQLYALKTGGIVELQRFVGEPLDLVIHDQVIAKGEVVAVNNNYGIRITHVESIKKI